MIERAFGLRILLLSLITGTMGAALALAADPRGINPLIVPFLGVLIGIGVGLRLRGHEIIDVLSCGFLALFAFYMGFGTVRLFEGNVLMEHLKIAQPVEFTPILLVGAVGYAILIAVLVTYPVSLIPTRNQPPRERDRAFLQYLEENDKT